LRNGEAERVGTHEIDDQLEERCRQVSAAPTSLRRPHLGVPIIDHLRDHIIRQTRFWGRKLAIDVGTRRVRCALAARRIGAITSESPSSSTVFSKLTRYRHYRAAILCLNWRSFGQAAFNADTGDRVSLIRHTSTIAVTTVASSSAAPIRVLASLTAPGPATLLSRHRLPPYYAAVRVNGVPARKPPSLHENDPMPPDSGQVSRRPDGPTVVPQGMV
jgi:hypothetical protein